MDKPAILQTLAIVFGLALVLVRAISFDISGVSDFELQKRAKEGDPEARRERFFRERIPFLLALQYLVSALLTGVVIIATVYAVGVGWGIFWLLVGLCLVEALSRWKPVVNLGQKLFRRYGGAIVHFTLKVNWLLKRFKRSGHSSSTPSFYSREEFIRILEKDTRVLSDQEKMMIEKVLDYSQKSTAKAMIPIKKIEFVSANDTVGPLLLDQLHKTGHACFPVQDDDKNIVGVLWLEDVHIPLKPRIKQIKDAMRTDLRYVRQDWPLNYIVQASLHTRRHLFIVIDETQKIVGMITMSDALQFLTSHNTGVNMLVDYEDPKNVADLSDVPKN